MRWLVLAFLLTSCAANPVRSQKPISATCVPELSWHGSAIRSDVLRFYREAYTRVQLLVEAPDMCGVEVAIYGYWKPLGQMRECGTSQALACVQKTRRKGKKPHFTIWYRTVSPEYLHHEWMHIMLHVAGVPSRRHHRLFNRVNSYYYPSGKNESDQ